MKPQDVMRAARTGGRVCSSDGWGGAAIAVKDGTRVQFRLARLRIALAVCAVVLVAPSDATSQTTSHPVKGVGQKNRPGFQFIWVNNTKNLGDDLVEMTAAFPHYAYWVRAKAKSLYVLPAFSVDLTNPDRRLGFYRDTGAGDPGGATPSAGTLKLPVVGGQDNPWVPFWISGVSGSQQYRDAIIVPSATGGQPQQHPMTVFWYDGPTLTITPGGPYRITTVRGTPVFIPQPAPGATFAGSVTLRPSGMDRKQPVLTALRVGFVQNGTFQRAYAWSQPSVTGRGNANVGELVDVPNVATVQTLPALQILHLDMDNRATTPLYMSTGSHAIKPLAPGRTSKIDSSDLPFHFLRPPEWTGNTRQGNQVTATYTRLSGAALNDNFQLWLVVYHAAARGNNAPQGGTLVPYSALGVRAWHIHAIHDKDNVGFPGFTHANGGAAFADALRTPAAPGDTPPVITGDTANALLQNHNNYQTQYSTKTTTLTVK